MKSPNSLESVAPRRLGKRAIWLLVAAPLLVLAFFKGRALYRHYFPRVLVGNSQPIHLIAFSPDGKSVVGASAGDYKAEGEIRLWNWHTGRLLRQLNCDPGVTAINFSTDGKKLFRVRPRMPMSVSGAGSIGVGADQLHSPPSQPRTYSAKQNLSLHYYGKVIETSDMQRGSLLSTSSHEFYGSYLFKNLLVSPDGVQVDVSPPSNVDLYDVVTGKKRWSVDLRTQVAGLREKTASTYLSNPLFVSVGSIAVNSEAVGWVLLSARNGQVQHILGSVDLNRGVVAVSPNGRWLAQSARSGDIKLLDVGSGQQVRVLRGHERTISSLVFSPDGNSLISNCNDGLELTMRLWDVNTGREKQRWDNIYAYQTAFSPDGKTLAAATIDIKTQQGNVKLWDISDCVP